MTEENSDKPAETENLGGGTPPATPPASEDDKGTPDVDDALIDKLVPKLLEKLRGAGRPSGAPSSFRDVEQMAREAVEKAIPEHLKQTERDNVLQQLKDKVEKEFTPKKYKGLAGFLFGWGDEDK